MTYEEFLQAKKIEVNPSGFEPAGINPILFDFQAACKNCRAAEIELKSTSLFGDAPC